MRTRWLALIAALLLTISSNLVRADTAEWPIDRAHSRVTFTVTKWGFVEVEGRFLDFTGKILYDAARPEASRVDWRVRVASVETGAVNRDKSLQEADYFDAARHPELRFTSERVRPLAAGQIEVQGTLMMRGQSRPLTIRVACGGVHTVPGEGTFEIFQTEFTINRYDFGINGGSVLGPAISKDVHVKIIAATNHQAPQDLEFIRAWERAQQLRPKILTSRARIAPVGEPGTAMIIAGRLFARDGRTPAPGVTVFAYHTDARGIYDERANGPHSWRLKGWAVTNADGRFEFETIRPAPYPNGRTPAHVHLSLEGPGLQRRWAGLMFEDDPLVPADERAKSASAGQFGSVRPVVMRNGAQQVELAMRIVDEGVF